MTTVPARIILSRKGFDSKFGGRPSPIFHDQTMLSLPIPEEGTGVEYDKIPGPRNIPNLGYLVERLRSNNIGSGTGVHLDPDLRREQHRDTERSWRPLFGQSDAAERHLEKQGLDAGDLFLFFGWFRQVDDCFSYKRLAPDLHMLWGWLQVDCYFDPMREEPEWAKHHPHCIRKNRKHNRIYVGRKSLTFASTKPGAGAFRECHPRLRLTDDVSKVRSDWRLPVFFRAGLTYHRNATWKLSGQYVKVRSASIGQEFVFHTKGHERAVGEWLGKLFADVPSGESY